MTKKVIWAEDVDTFRMTIVDILKDYCSGAGIEVNVDEASNGRELVEKVLGTNYDLIFTDHQMPEVDGLQAIAQIREHNKTVPVYMVSNSEVEKQALQAGATGYFWKVDSVSGMEQAVNLHLK